MTTPAISPLSLEGHRCVLISDLRLEMSIGIFPHERQTRQLVLVGIHMFVPESGPAGSEDVSDYVSYADVVEAVQRLAASRHFELVENLAEQIAKLALADKRVARVVVDVRKPDIIPEAASVGVIIERRNR